MAIASCTTYVIVAGCVKLWNILCGEDIAYLASSADSFRCLSKLVTFGEMKASSDSLMYGASLLECFNDSGPNSRYAVAMDVLCYPWLMLCPKLAKIMVLSYYGHI